MPLLQCHCDPFEGIRQRSRGMPPPWMLYLKLKMTFNNPKVQVMNYVVISKYLIPFRFWIWEGHTLYEFGKGCVFVRKEYIWWCEVCLSWWMNEVCKQAESNAWILSWIVGLEKRVRHRKKDIFFFCSIFNVPLKFIMYAKLKIHHYSLPCLLLLCLVKSKL